MEVINKSFLINENNVLDLYKKLVNNEDIAQTDLDAVKKRFNELVNYNSTL